MKLHTMLIVFFYSSVVMYPSRTTNMCFVHFLWLDSKFSVFSTSPSFFLDRLNIIILESNFCFNYRKLSTTSSMGITYLKSGRLPLFDGSKWKLDKISNKTLTRPLSATISQVVLYSCKTRSKAWDGSETCYYPFQDPN